jgi:hypothetical protein
MIFVAVKKRSFKTGEMFLDNEIPPFVRRSTKTAAAHVQATSVDPQVVSVDKKKNGVVEIAVPRKG